MKVPACDAASIESHSPWRPCSGASDHRAYHVQKEGERGDARSDGEEGDDEGLDVDVRLVELVEAVAERVVEVPAQVGVEVQPRNLNLPRAADKRARRRVRALLPRDRRRRLPRLRHVVADDGRQILWLCRRGERRSAWSAGRARVRARARAREAGGSASRSGGPAVTSISRPGHSLSYSSGGLSPPGTTAGFEPLHSFDRSWKLISRWLALHVAKPSTTAW